MLLGVLSGDGARKPEGKKQLQSNKHAGSIARLCACTPVSGILLTALLAADSMPPLAKCCLLLVSMLSWANMSVETQPCPNGFSYMPVPVSHQAGPMGSSWCHAARLRGRGGAPGLFKIRGDISDQSPPRTTEMPGSGSIWKTSKLSAGEQVDFGRHFILKGGTQDSNKRTNHFDHPHLTTL